MDKEKTVSKNTKIEINVGLNDKDVPLQIEWKSDDNPNPGDSPQIAKAMLLSMFDKKNMETLKIDLWTYDMQVMEMDRFFYQTFRGLADTYFKATQNRELSVEMQKFVQYFGEKTEVIPKDS
jgi:gliding motility-associated protein GldC